MKNILFLNLATFRQTGGIEKVNRAVLKAFDDLSNSNQDIQIKAISVYDTDAHVDENFISRKKCLNCGGHKLLFLFRTAMAYLKADKILLGHINLLPLIAPLKFIMPHKKIFLYAYGIDVWNLSQFHKKIIRWMNPRIISISHFTSHKLQQQFDQKLDIVRITPCIDPFLKAPTQLQKVTGKFNQQKDRFVILTLTRLSAGEQYKGYDRMLEALTLVKPAFPDFLYIIAGKADRDEQIRVEKLIEKFDLKNQVFLTGFVADNDIPELFLTADLFAMPSLNEGFGITFIEASLFGLQNIAGNIDGSKDALLNGALGELVDPNNIEQIAQALLQNANQRDNLSQEMRFKRQQLTVKNFSFEQFKKLITAELLSR